jgi:hypothetical protein
MDSAIEKMNEIMNEITTNIHNYTTVKMRSRNISIENVLVYKFMYTKLDKTKQHIVSMLNCNTKSNTACRTSYDRKEQHISITLYENIYLQLIFLYNKLNGINHTKNVSTFPIIAVDGTNNNTNIRNGKPLEVALNMGFYDINQQIPVNLIPCGAGNRNKEVQQLLQYIYDYDITNVIFVADRAYSSHNLWNKLHESNNKFIIRIKSNSNILKRLKSKENSKELRYFGKRVRIIRHNETYYKTVKRKGKLYTLEVTAQYDLITNLMNRNTFPDSKILEIYRSRWDVEVFFKLVKTNFKFSKLIESKPEQTHKSIYCELSLCYISKILENIYLKTQKYSNIIKKKNGKKVKCAITVNKTNIIKGIYDNLLVDIIQGNLTVDKLNKFCNSYIIIIKNEPNRAFSRKSKIPFSKWYVKQYHEKYDYDTIIEALINDDKQNLNKNLKVKGKHVKIINIVYLKKDEKENIKN